MSKAEEYRARAIECDQLADKAKDTDAKRMLIEAANKWRTMAEQAESVGW